MSQTFDLVGFARGTVSRVALDELQDNVNQMMASDDEDSKADAPIGPPIQTASRKLSNSLLMTFSRMREYCDEAIATTDCVPPNQDDLTLACVMLQDIIENLQEVHDAMEGFRLVRLHDTRCAKINQST